MKFDLNTFDRVRTLTPENMDRVRNDKFLQAVFSQDSGANTCSCDNFILEAHYKVYFKQDETEPNQFVISDFKVELVYGKISLDCSTTHTFNLKTSITYLESENGRIFSGSPGYLHGAPVMIGQTGTEEL